jgi:hypothetical protein
LPGVRIVAADSEESGDEAQNAIDGNPGTIWHTAWRNESPKFPHELQIDFKTPINLRGFTVLPRQDSSRNGWIKDYCFYASTDGKKWGKPIASGCFGQDKDLKTVTFNSVQGVRFVRLVALSTFDARPYASLAEFSVLRTEK